MRTSTHFAVGLALTLIVLVAASRPAASALNTELVASGLNRPIFVTAPP